MKKNKAILLVIFLLISTLGISQSNEKEVKEYYDNGQLMSIGNTIDGTLTGKWKYYHDNGQLKEIGKYDNGITTGIWKTYYENGKLNFKIKYIEGFDAVEWNTNGILDYIY